MTSLYVDRSAENGQDFDSGSIDIVGYDRESKTLYVEFLSGYAVYAYEGVEESTYNLFVAANSLNSFWRDHISGKYTSEKHDEGVIVQRNDEASREPVTGDVAVGASSGVGEAMVININPSDIFHMGGLLTTSLVTPSKYGVKWTNGTLTFEPEFQANSEADALAQFNAAVSQVMPDADVKILAVTHYFD